MKKTVLALVILFAILFISCSKEESDPNEEYNTFLNLLTNEGFEYTEAEIDNESFLSVSRRPLLIGDEIISVYQYKSKEDMERDSTYIDKGGCSINRPEGGVDISWVSYPHFYKKDTLIINYVGEDDGILKLLNENYGPQFAGYEG